ELTALLQVVGIALDGQLLLVEQFQREPAGRSDLWSNRRITPGAPGRMGRGVQRRKRSPRHESETDGVAKPEHALPRCWPRSSMKSPGQIPTLARPRLHGSLASDIHPGQDVTNSFWPVTRFCSRRLGATHPRTDHLQATTSQRRSLLSSIHFS